MFWNDIVEKYPDRWVALSDCEMDGSQVISGVVQFACTEEERFSVTDELTKQGISFRWRRTTPINDIGIKMIQMGSSLIFL